MPIHTVDTYDGNSSFGTRLIHAQTGITEPYGAVNVPVYQVSTFDQRALAGDGLFDYSRSGNPTRKALENTIAQLEGGCAGFAFASGMAAISSVFCLLNQGDKVLISRDIYGGTYRVLTRLFPRFGIEPQFVDMTDLEAVTASITLETRMIFIETPSNPLMKITDIAAVSAIARQYGILTVVDNTFMTPYLQKPLALGADIVVHSATKYIGGHSDVVGGLVVVAEEDLAEEIYFVQNSFGAILGPQDSWLLLRGLKTLKIRLDQHQATALELARWLSEQPQIERVYYPGLADHPDHELAARQASGFGGIVSFEFHTEEEAESFLERTKIPALAVSLGAVESILTHPIRMSHASIPEEVRRAIGITGRLVRLSVGLEEAADLQADFAQALSVSTSPA
ncbi:cystathionine beta-lyase [Aneurinibacillus soli]|uniref:cysteine-S-conjugate beta-lyase n=1 Tax=Aneurinibacillus soli TaxID=1500254 RepID=A0A0U5AQC9_9BACL|nr:PLP-dependent aspartate aminotransferase family protein [Aneurinibacillus soli]PYE58967.1 cystathionine beta-lyase [Aneurinibacillus soli]BAU26017.1 Cystathionine beta-lyase MetC [Aneurinibacillus soli]